MIFNTASHLWLSGKNENSNREQYILGQWGLKTGGQFEVDTRKVLHETSPEDLQRFVVRATAGVPAWGYREGDPLVKRLCYSLMNTLVLPSSTVNNLKNLEGLENRPVVFLGNHLSALDVHMFQFLLATKGNDVFSNRLTAVVGYKSFELPFLRQMSLAFGTLKVPQSSSIQSGTLEMKVRDLAKHAQAVLVASSERLTSGDCLMVFPEGTRSRSGELLQCIPAVAKYLRRPGVVIVPFGHYGTENILPVADPRLNPAQVVLNIGKPIESEALSRKYKGFCRSQQIMDRIGTEIAALLPDEYRGFYRKGHENFKNI